LPAFGGLRKIMTRRLKTVDLIQKYNKDNLLKSPTKDEFSTKLELLQFQLWNNFLVPTIQLGQSLDFTAQAAQVCSTF
jgi:hypothetical protein